MEASRLLHDNPDYTLGAKKQAVPMAKRLSKHLQEDSMTQDFRRSFRAHCLGRGPVILPSCRPQYPVKLPQIPTHRHRVKLSQISTHRHRAHWQEAINPALDLSLEEPLPRWSRSSLQPVLPGHTTNAKKLGEALHFLLRHQLETMNGPSQK